MKHAEDGRPNHLGQAIALQMPSFKGGSFDAVVCQFAIMFFPDNVYGYAAALRVLKPGGSFIFNVWGARY